MAALASGASRVTAVEPNEIAVEAAQIADPRHGGSSRTRAALSRSERAVRRSRSFNLH